MVHESPIAIIVLKLKESFPPPDDNFSKRPERHNKVCHSSLITVLLEQNCMTCYDSCAVFVL